MPVNALDLTQQQAHLEKVSRTFALTIPMLNGALADYVSNAYLICRIADTVEDDPKAAPESRYAWLTAFAGYCAGGFADELKLMELHKKGMALVKEGAKPAEYKLIEEMPRVILRTLSYPKKVVSALARGVSIMACGMALSIRGRKIETSDDVDRYCYFVAGVVGEVLAELFAITCPKADRQKLLDLSVSFGEGLQLTNILKDRVDDKEREASFLPQVPESGLSQQIRDYAAVAQGHLDDALRFILLIPKSEKGVRQFCFLNIAMAAATLKKITRNPQGDGIRLKISHGTVATLLFLTKLGCGSNFMLKKIYSLLSFTQARVKRDPVKLRAAVSWFDKETFNILPERQD